MNKLIETRIYEMLLEKFATVENPEEVSYCPECGYAHTEEKEDAKRAHEKMGDVELYDELNDIDESAPAGYEKIVKTLKKQPGVKNAWAVANSMKNKGIHPKK